MFWFFVLQVFVCIDYRGEMSFCCTCFCLLKVKAMFVWLLCSETWSVLQGTYLIEDSANHERSPTAIYIIYMLWLYLAISAEYHTDDLLLARRISSALALAILLSRTKPSLYNTYRPIVNTVHLVNDSGNNHLELSSNNNKPYPIFRPLPCHRFGLTFAVYAIILPDHYCPASKCFFLNWYDVLYKKPETSIILPSSMTHIPTYIFPQGVYVNLNLISFRYDIIYWYIDIYFDWYLHTP